MKQNTLQQAKSEIRTILNRYGLTWREILPDVDEEIWNELEPEMKRIRKQIFQKKYPRLYAQSQRKA